MAGNQIGWRKPLRRAVTVVAAVCVAVGMTLGFVQAADAAPGWPVLSNGSSGPNVGVAQHLLRAHGYNITPDHDFGPQTQGAVVAFQRSRGFTADGIIGQQTWGGLIITVRTGDSGEAVAAAQTALNKYGYGLSVDGAFGPATTSATRSFQGANGLTADGIIGPLTWQSLVGGGGGGGGYSLPIPRGALSRGYYYAPHHDYPAIDLPVGTGTQLYAVRSGVAYQINNSRCGLGYSLSGDDGASYLYCHLSSHRLGSGTRVGAGALLGWSGSTGNATGPHLHLEIVAGGANRCPQSYLLAIYDGGTPPSASSLPTTGCIG